MAKKKTTARKTRQSAFLQRSSYANSNSNSKAPSNASSPSPQPVDQAHGGRKKAQPRRSPSHNDPSKGIVFSFRIQKDPALSMTVDIRNYDQQFGQPEVPEGASSLQTDSDTWTSVTSTGAGTPLALSHASSHSECSGNSSRSSFSGPSSPLPTSSSELRVGGERWTSDPALYRSNNVLDHSRNLLILHTRKPLPTAAAPATEPAEARFNGFNPYRPQRSLTSGSSSSTGSSLPSTPALTHSGSSSSSSSVLSSPTSSPTSPQSPTEASRGCSSTSKEETCITEALPLAMDNISLASTRLLSVRGLGGGSKRMQVIVV